jgi:16S rRNA (cytosine967-C5)-methyltransferase
VLPQENEAQVDAFLAANRDFAVVPLAQAWAEAAGLAGDPPCAGPYLRLTPLRHGTDGFFGAVLQRGAA